MTRYPLATVVALRAAAVDHARLDLARALEVLEVRRAAVALHEAALAAHAVRAAEAERGTAAAAAGQGLAPAELAARARWSGRLRAELGVLAGALAQAQRAASSATRDAEALRERLAAARAGLRALEVHREGWRNAEGRRSDAREQDAADDLVSARRAAR